MSHFFRISWFKHYIFSAFYNNDLFHMFNQSAIMKQMTKRIDISLFLAAIMVGTFVPNAHAQAQVKAEIESGSFLTEVFGVENPLLIKAGITQALEAGRVGQRKFSDTPGMKAFYQARDYESVWLESSFLQPQKAKILLEAFEDSWKHGLNPSAYHVEEIRRLMDEAKNAERFELDLVLSDALVRYGRDLTGMRVNPRSIGQRSKYWRQPLRGIDILDHVANATDARSAVEGLAPQGALYKKLQRELVKLYKTPEQDTDLSTIRLNRNIRPGNSNKAVLKIRERMGFNPSNAIEGAYVYDDELASAVMAFQKAHGLTPDGIIGSHTIKLMNMSRDDRINQVLVKFRTPEMG